MLSLYTGAPGAGKTLKMLSDFLANADGSRPIYVYGVEGLVPSDKWLPLDDPKKWHECPHGSLVLIDEAQTVFRPRRPGDPVPEHIAAAETHRHLGLDLIMTTQYPMLIDAHLRRLVSDHQHLVNVWGLKGRSSVFEWDEAQDDPKDPRARKLARRFMFKYPKAVFALYKSAQVHTKKPRVPAWFKFGLPIVFLILAVAGYFVYYSISHFASNGSKPVKNFLSAHSGSSPVSGSTHVTSSLSGSTSSPAVWHKRPLSHFDSYSLPVRNRQAAKLAAISDKFWVVGRISSGSESRWVITSKSGNVHLVLPIRCSDFEGLEVCRWGGGYVASRPVAGPVNKNPYPVSHFPDFNSRAVVTGSRSVSCNDLAILPAVAPADSVHHHSLLLPAKYLPGGG
ncbi:MAG: zonular occludens toxin domain-containing protein [Acidithiobacillus sp.]|nr:zonular occludens toxin domain-containing protein [Acidithiobacillus sp.]